MTTKSMILSLVVGAAVGGLVTWKVMDGRAPVAGERVERPTDAGGTPDPTTARAPETVEVAGPIVLEGRDVARANVEAILEKNEELEAQVKDLENRIADLLPTRDPSAFRFGVPDQATEFDKAEWTDLAVHMTALGGVLTEFKTGILEGGEPDARLIKTIQDHNTPLAMFAVKVFGQIGGANANAAYTHPAVIANLIRAALEEAGDPLSREQEIAIRTLGDAWIAEVERMEGRTTPSTPELAKTVATVDAKERFIESVKRGVLSASQRGVLFHEATEGRAQLDLLSPVLVYAIRHGVPAASEEALATELVTQLFSMAGVELEDLSPFRWVGERWVGDLPRALLVPIGGRSESLVFPRLDDLQQLARIQVAATERILAQRGLEEGDAERIRSMATLLAPYIQLGGVPDSPSTD